MVKLLSTVSGLALASALAFASTAALADGGPSSRARAEGPAPISWSGLYFGASIGYASGDADFRFTDGNRSNFWNIAGNPGDARNGAGFDLDGIIGGGHVGLSHQFGQYVVGVEFSASGGDLDTKITSPAVPASDTWRTKASWLTTTSLRLGYVVTPNTMFYAKAGVATGFYQTQFDDRVVCPSICNGATSKTHVGYNLGLGLEHAISPLIRVGLQYDYTSLDSADHTGVTRLNGTTFTETHNLRLTPGDMHAVSARLSFWLQREAPVAVRPLK